MAIRFALPAPGVLTPNNDKDPLPYYYRPGIGWLFRHRLQMGLELLPPGGRAALEIGVGSGILVPTLTRAFARYTGTDLELPRNLERLVAAGCQAEFRAADLLDPDALPANAFDVVVCFSVLEHIADSDGAAACLARTLTPGGTLLTGYPMVNQAMTRAFSAIGYTNIDEDHVASPRQIETALAKVLRPGARAAFPPLAPRDLALYQCRTWTRA